MIRKNSIHTEPIKWENHIKWFEEKLADKNIIFLIAEDNDLFVGEIRLDKQYHITIHLAASHRGKGLGTGLIEAAAARMDAPVVAQIKDDVAVKP